MQHLKKVILHYLKHSGAHCAQIEYEGSTKRRDLQGAGGWHAKKWFKGNMAVIKPNYASTPNKHRLGLDKIYVAMSRSAFGQFFIVTETKRTGLAPRFIMEGDIICVLLGCSVPVILRPATNPINAGLYDIIGDSYIHGIMDGEAMARLEAGDYELQDFTIV